jgi:hypothetical protein
MYATLVRFKMKLLSTRYLIICMSVVKQIYSRNIVIPIHTRARARGLTTLVGRKCKKAYTVLKCRLIFVCKVIF